MERVIIIVERAEDGTYAAYGESVPAYGMGETIEEAKNEALKGLQLFIETNEPALLPAILRKPYEIEFNLDLQSLLNYYKGIFTNAAFERITGINQKQIQHYASGIRKPSPATRKKIELALHKLGNELTTLRL